MSPRPGQAQNVAALFEALGKSSTGPSPFVLSVEVVVDAKLGSKSRYRGCQWSQSG